MAMAITFGLWNHWQQQFRIQPSTLYKKEMDHGNHMLCFNALRYVCLCWMDGIFLRDEGRHEHGAFMMNMEFDEGKTQVPYPWMLLYRI